MGYTFDGGEAWGSRLEPVDKNYIAVVHADPSKVQATEETPVIASLPEHLDSVIQTFSMYKSETLADIKNKALTDLKAITEGIEADIAYFNTLGGLAIAMNKLGIIKQDLKKVMTGLERI